MRLRDELGEGDSGEDEDGAGCGDEAEAFSGDEEGCDPGKDWLEGEDERGVGGGQDGLCPALDGKRGGSGEYGGDKERDNEARREVDLRVLDERQADGHEECAESDLNDGEGPEGNAWRDVAEGDAVKGESDGAAEGKDVAKVQGGEVGKQGRDG